MNTVQMALLKDAVEWVEYQATLPPEKCEWNQKDWIDGKAPCGTAFCLGDYVGQKLEPAFRQSEYAELGGQEWHVSDYAQQALGLEVDQADDLFFSENSVEDIRRIAEEIAGEKL